MPTGDESIALSMLTGEERELYDKAHERNIEKLMGLYGEDNEAEILKCYNRIRERHETDANLADFIPICAFREFYDTYPLLS